MDIKPILIHFQPTDWEGNYWEGGDCPLSRAVQRELKTSNVSVRWGQWLSAGLLRKKQIIETWCTTHEG